MAYLAGRSRNHEGPTPSAERCDIRLRSGHKAALCLDEIDCSVSLTSLSADRSYRTIELLISGSSL